MLIEHEYKVIEISRDLLDEWGNPWPRTYKSPNPISQGDYICDGSNYHVVAFVVHEDSISKLYVYPDGIKKKIQYFTEKLYARFSRSSSNPSKVKSFIQKLMYSEDKNDCT